MKKIKLLFLLLISTAVFLISCSKEITERTENIAALNPTNIDLNAGTWKTILLKRPDTFLVNTPALTNSPAYVAELNEVKGLQQNISGAQKNIIKYWSTGSVLRWNEIMRELVAKHNLPPYQNGDATYPAPNS
ncbi:MAG: PA-phosphatase, partial [Bacteroidota bacterium]|nr:PA-phosphatase [Bacteroidota bacterium]